MMGLHILEDGGLGFGGVEVKGVGFNFGEEVVR
jgi:hypothetical protein